MSVTSSCPRCQKQVTIPDGLGAASVMRCPLCEAEYELREATVPPMLIVVAAKTDDGQPIVPAAAPAPFALAGEQEPIAEGQEPLAKAQAEPALHPDDDHWTRGWAAADDAATAEHVETASDAAVFGAITGKFPPAEEGEGIRRLPPQLPGAPEVEGAEPAAATATAVLPEPLPRRRRRHREPHPVRIFIGMVISAFLAVAVFYWSANFFTFLGGETNDKAGIRLPFVPHTSKYWCWWTPWKWNTPPAENKENKEEKKPVVNKNSAPKAPPKSRYAQGPGKPIPRYRDYSSQAIVGKGHVEGQTTEGRHIEDRTQNGTRDDGVAQDGAKVHGARIAGQPVRQSAKHAQQGGIELRAVGRARRRLSK